MENETKDRCNTIKLKCEECGCAYEKPYIFKEFILASERNVFFKWSLTFCDKCRRKKEVSTLRALPDVLNAIANSPPTNKE